jgi:hypothetical protein
MCFFRNGEDNFPNLRLSQSLEALSTPLSPEIFQITGLDRLICRFGWKIGPMHPVFLAQFELIARCKPQI